MCTGPVLLVLFTYVEKLAEIAENCRKSWKLKVFVICAI